MVPITLDPSRLSLGLCGRGELAAKRLRWLRDGGARSCVVFADRADAELSAVAGGDLCRRLPTAADLRDLDVLWIADLPQEDAEPLVALARQHKVLVNLEDVRPACDFHNPALVRRGDLLMTVSTNGASPGLAARIRRDLEARYDESWADRLNVIARKRDAWRRRSRPLEQLAELTDAVVDANGWLRPLEKR